MTQYPASEKQLSFIKSLAAERGVPNYPTADLTKKGASNLIETLLAMPKVAKAGAVATAKKEAISEDGIYFLEENGEVTIYKVQIAKQGSGNLYAKKLILPDKELGELKGEWVYEGRKPLYLDLQKLDAETAKAFGLLYGVCMCCGATLTDEKSIEAGIGPWCAKKYLSA